MTPNRSLTNPNLTPSGVFRIVAIAETCTWAMLGGAMLLRAAIDADWTVSVAGPIHGFVFLVYIAMQLIVGRNQRWEARTILVGIGSGIVPFASMKWGSYLHGTGRLDGGWRTDASDDPHDRTAIDRAFRWCLRHPIALIGVAAFAVAVVFALLLAAGPPTQWLK